MSKHLFTSAPPLSEFMIKFSNLFSRDVYFLSFPHKHLYNYKMLYNMPVFKDNKREGNYCSFRAAVWKYHALIKIFTCIWQLHGLFRTREKWSEMKRQKSKSFSPSSFQVDKRPKKGKALYVCDSKLLPRLEQVYSFCILNESRRSIL